TGGADVTGTPLPITDPSMPIAPSPMQRITARAFGAGVTEAGVTEAGATGVGATEAGAEVGGAGSDQLRLSPRSAILPAAKLGRQQPKSSQCRSGSAWHPSGESG